jgi:hypothetical protein
MKPVGHGGCEGFLVHPSSFSPSIPIVPELESFVDSYHNYHLIRRESCVRNPLLGMFRAD